MGDWQKQRLDEFKWAKKIHLAHSQSALAIGSPIAAPLTNWIQLLGALRAFWGLSVPQLKEQPPEIPVRQPQVPRSHKTAAATTTAMCQSLSAHIEEETTSALLLVSDHQIGTPLLAS